MHPAVALGLVFSGCCSNVVFLELLVREHPGCGNLITFAQFLFIAIEGFIFEANFGRKRPAIPLRFYLTMVAMFFTVSVVNNYALNLNIAMPLHMIFRSGSLIASMVLGIVILKKRYSVSKYSSIALVSAGIFTCTFMSAKQVSSDSSRSEDEDGISAFLWWLLGIAALTFALLMSARMGLFQETLYERFGKHSKEALFYNHALPLPGFFLLAPDIYRHAVLFNQSEPFQVPVLGLNLPILWFYLIMNIITQYICIRGVFILTTECTSLTVTLVVTLRKFVSLIFSILYFSNPFTTWHWIGTLLVFVGTLMYTEIWNSLGPRVDPEKKPDKKQE
ncbi:UDP-xylose and UDP-N-acetylglucosamine transporter [Sphaerodactylus townsendi]|uniref:UDP-xylose and UDP-N-acetylglucosamine transporter n=1 Tax=Sphaerodactylus townsendi TaxID=933632 RepID=UPI002026F710|nr:UDP-xylose and UDP-N-acetylglucosamine transporter [Sphaerodactylus townsendi]